MMNVKNNSAPERETKRDLNLQGYLDQEFDSEFFMMQLDTEADRATRAQVNLQTPPKGRFGRLMHWLSNLVFGS